MYLYYGLDNFYQNHRRYVKSRDDDQLLGKDDSNPNINCKPFSKDIDGWVYAPCGAIANSMFNGKEGGMDGREVSVWLTVLYWGTLQYCPFLVCFII